MNYQLIKIADQATLLEPWMMGIIQELYGYNLQMSEYIRIFAEDFKVKVTEKELNQYFEPTLDEEIKDLQLIYERI